ncbi:MAG: fatty acid desaturase family protein [Sulfurifustaceae bacterium]
MTEVRERARPVLPAEFFEPEPAWVVLYFAYSFALYFGCGYLGYAAAMSSWPLLLKIPAVIVMGLLASNGLHVLGWLSHEGIHLSMVKSKTANMVLGAFAGSVFFFPSVGLGISHWPHHRFTNEADDPDTAVLARFRGFWSRLFFARIAANRKFTQNAVAVVLGKPMPKSYRLPFSQKQLAFYSALGFGFMLLWLIGYIVVGIYNLSYVMYAFVLPYLLLIPTTGIRPYLEHGGTQPGEFKDSRSYTSWFYTILLFGNNYHLEHHLYPKVPGYKLPRVHKWLSENGYHERHQPPIVGGVLAALRCSTKRYPYPYVGSASVGAAVSPQSETIANV